MGPLDDELTDLYRLMDQQVSNYHLLIEELKKEGEYLRQGSIDSLMKVLKNIDSFTQAIARLHTSVQESVEKLLEGLGKDKVEKRVSLLTCLPSRDRARMKSYRNELGQLQEWVRMINEKNKVFIQEHLAFLGDLTTRLFRPDVESPGYLPDGGPTSSPPLSYSLNREV
jgi:hypothetical protein